MSFNLYRTGVQQSLNRLGFPCQESEPVKPFIWPPAFSAAGHESRSHRRSSQLRRCRIWSTWSTGAARTRDGGTRRARASCARPPSCASSREPNRRLRDRWPIGKQEELVCCYRTSATVRKANRFVDEARFNEQLTEELAGSFERLQMWRRPAPPRGATLRRSVLIRNPFTYSACFLPAPKPALIEDAIWFDNLVYCIPNSHNNNKTVLGYKLYTPQQYSTRTFPYTHYCTYSSQLNIITAAVICGSSFIQYARVLLLELYMYFTVHVSYYTYSTVYLAHLFKQNFNLLILTKSLSQKCCFGLIFAPY